MFVYKERLPNGVVLTPILQQLVPSPSLVGGTFLCYRCQHCARGCYLAL